MVLLFMLIEDKLNTHIQLLYTWDKTSEHYKRVHIAHNIHQNCPNLINGDKLKKYVVNLKWWEDKICSRYMNLSGNIAKVNIFNIKEVKQADNVS